jgi:hypothetical protein
VLSFGALPRAGRSTEIRHIKSTATRVKMTTPASWVIMPIIITAHNRSIVHWTQSIEGRYSLLPPRLAPSLVLAVAANAPPKDCTMRAARSNVRKMISTAIG